jgi:predicted permease
MMRRLRNFLSTVVHRDRLERELRDEYQATFDQLVAEQRRRGASATDASRAATIALGRSESFTERVRDARAGAQWEAFVLDVRHGVRLMRRSPVFSLFAVSSLALGIGATAAIFALFDGVVLRKLPVPEPDRLVVASFGGPGGRFNYSMPYPHFEQIKERNTTLTGIFAMYPFGRVTVAAGGQGDAAQGTYVSGDYYWALGIAPSAGRLLGPSDDRPGEAVAVLNHAYWQRRFGGRADVIGSTINLNAVPFTVVGVEPPGFFGTEVGRPYDVAVPMRAMTLLQEGQPLWEHAFASWIYMMARLKPGATREAAEAELKSIFVQTSIAHSLNADQERLAREHQLRLESAATGRASDLRAGYERWLGLLLLMLGAVLLLASLNLATLMLSRSDARHREIATRLALGAGRVRVIRQLLTESIVLSAAGAAAGLLLATWGSRELLRVATPAADRLTVQLTPDFRLVAFTAGLALLTCLFFGLMPAIRATAPGRFVAARQVGGGRQRRVLDRVLVGAQVAVSLVLLVSAGLFLRTVDKLWRQDPGYDRRNVLMFSVDARLAGKKGPEVPGTYQRVLDGLEEVPGVQSVALSAVRPVSESYYFVTSFREVGGRTLTGDQRVRAAFNRVAPGYFATLGIPLRDGRDFDERDTLGAPEVAIISERWLRHFKGNPVGQRLGQYEVIGVAKDVRYANVKDAPREVVYLPMFQSQPRDIFYSPTFEIRYSGSVATLTQAVRETVARIEPSLSLFRVTTLEEMTRDSLSRERLLAMLASYVGGFAVLLACIGLYGLLSYGVSLRTAEMGLRIALGAQPRSVRWLIVREATAMVASGAVLGLIAMYPVVQLVRSQLFGIEPSDPIALAGAIAVLLTLAFAAAYLPATRASRVDPLTALRHE